MFLPEKNNLCLTKSLQNLNEISTFTFLRLILCKLAMNIRESVSIMAFKSSSSRTSYNLHFLVYQIFVFFGNFYKPTLLDTFSREIFPKHISDFSCCFGSSLSTTCNNCHLFSAFNRWTTVITWKKIHIYYRIV
jgi:hypothetical protein